MSYIQLKILLPNRVFLEISDVSSVIAETPEGSFGILPNREDCVATLKPGILVYRTSTGQDQYVATDQGTLIKFNQAVWISVRGALVGSDLTRLRAEVIKQFLDVSEREKSVRSVMKKLESGFMRRIGELRGD